MPKFNPNTLDVAKCSPNRARLIRRYGVTKTLTLTDVEEIEAYHALAEQMAREITVKIDAQAPQIEGKWMKYKRQFLLETLIEKLNERV
jgi:hypothetical protein